jgi:hypothetical protein
VADMALVEQGRHVVRRHCHRRAHGCGSVSPASHGWRCMPDHATPSQRVGGSIPSRRTISEDAGSGPSGRRRDPRPCLVRRARHRAGVHLVQRPWLNWIEAEFTALRYFTPDGSNSPPTRPSWLSPATSVGPTATPPRYAASAVNSKIRRPDFPPNVA